MSASFLYNVPSIPLESMMELYQMFVAISCKQAYDMIRSGDSDAIFKVTGSLRLLNFFVGVGVSVTISCIYDIS